MADVEKININSTDYDIADAKALRTKATVGANSFIDTRAGSQQYPTDLAHTQSLVLGAGSYINSNSDRSGVTIIGNNAYASLSYSTILGYIAHGTSMSTSIGYNANSADNSVAIGSSATATYGSSVSVGSATFNNCTYGVVLGYNAGISTSGGGNRQFDTVVGASSVVAGSIYNTILGANSSTGANSSYNVVCGSSSTIANYVSNSSILGHSAYVRGSNCVQLGAGTNGNYGSLQFRDWPLVDSSGKIYEGRIPSIVRFTTDEPTVLEWQDDDELRKMVFMYTGTDNALFKHGLCYQATPKQGHPKFWCGYANTGYIPRQECVQVDNEKLFLKLAEISKARYLDDGNWANSLVGGDNAEQSFYFYYNVNDAQWRIEIGSDTLESSFSGEVDYYYFEQGETLEDFGIYVKDLTLPTDEGTDEELFDIYYYAPVYCDGYGFESNLNYVNYMQMMNAMCDTDWGFGLVIDNLEFWEYEVDGTTYNMPIIPEKYISLKDGDEYEDVTVRWEWDNNEGQWYFYINGGDTGYRYTTAKLQSRYGITLDVSEAETEYIEFCFRGAKQLYWQQFNPIDDSVLAKQKDLDALETEIQPLLDWKVNTVMLTAPNLDNYTTPGWYFFKNAPSATNKPGTCGNTFMMLVLASDSGSYISQYIFATQINLTVGGYGWGSFAPMVFHRQRFFNSWYAWRTQLSDGASAPYIQGFDNTKKQTLVHNASSPELHWVEESGGGSADDTYTNNTRNYIAVGNIIDDNGVISGFESVYPNGSSNIYAYSNITVPLGTNFEVGVKFTTGTVSADYSDQIISGETYPILSLNITNGKLVGQIGTTSDWDRNAFLTSTTSILSNSTYWAKLVHKNSLLQLYLSTDGTNYNLEASASSTTSVPTTNIILGTGRSKNTAAFRGSIDLNETYVNSNDTRIWIGANYSELNNLSTVTDYYVSGSSWYKETFSDATRTKRIWLEQGGVASSSSATINLLKSFSDINYVVTGGATNKTTSSFTLTNNANWVAIGV